MNSKLLLLLFACMLSVCSSVAQVSFVTTPPPCLSSYGSSSYRVSFQSTNPPVFPSTPINVILAYIAMDSVAKNASFSDVKTFLDRQDQYNDTVKKMLKYWYEAVDHSPVSYLSYIDDLDTTFISSPTTIIGQYQQILYRVSPYKIEDLLLGSSVFVIKGQVLSSSIDQTDSSADFNNSLRITVRVLDTIKGQTQPLHYCGSNQADASNKHAFIQSSGSASCLHIDYRPHLTQQMKSKNPGLDSSLYETPVAGDTCYFFLRAKHITVCSDGVYCSFTPIHQPVNLGVYRVIDGMIRTPRLEFTGLPIVAESVFLNGILSHVSRIKSY